MDIKINKKIACISFLCLSTITKTAIYQNSMDTQAAQKLFLQPQRTDDELLNIVHQILYNQKPALTSMVNRINLQQAMNKATPLARPAICSNSIMQVLGPSLIHGTPAQRHQAALTWATIVEKYAATTESEDKKSDVLLQPCMCIIQEIVQQPAVLWSLTNNEKKALTKNLAAIIYFLITKEYCLSGVMDAIQQLAAIGLVFAPAERARLTGLLERQSMRLPNTTIASIDQAYCALYFLPTARSMQRLNYTSNDFPMNRYINQLTPVLQHIIAAENISPTMILALLDTLAWLKNDMIKATIPERRANQTHINILTAWIQEQNTLLLDHLLKPVYREHFTQADALQFADYLLKNSTMEMTDLRDIQVYREAQVYRELKAYLLCAEVLIDREQINKAQQILIKLYPAPLLLTNQTMIQSYITAIQHLFEKMALKNPAMLKTSINNLIQPYNKLLIKQKQIEPAFNVLMTVSNALRKQAPLAQQRAIITEARMEILRLIKSRFLDFASPKQLNDLNLELKELSGKAGIDTALITKLKEELKQRKNQPYLNNGVIRWMLNGLSRRKA